MAVAVVEKDGSGGVGVRSSDGFMVSRFCQEVVR